MGRFYETTNSTLYIENPSETNLSNDFMKRQIRIYETNIYEITFVQQNAKRLISSLVFNLMRK